MSTLKLAVFTTAMSIRQASFALSLRSLACSRLCANLPLSDHQAQNAASPCPERDADADFMRSLRHGIRERRVDARRRQDYGQACQNAEQQSRVAPSIKRVARILLHRFDSIERNILIKHADSLGHFGG
jgi:hypothetical protein